MKKNIGCPLSRRLNSSSFWRVQSIRESFVVRECKADDKKSFSMTSNGILCIKA